MSKTGSYFLFKFLKEVDMALSVVRPDGLPFEPVQIGLVFGPDELKFMNVNLKGFQKFLDVISVVQSFDFLTYSYILYCTYCVITLAFAAKVMHKDKHHQFL